MCIKNKPTKMKKVLFALAIVATGMLASCGGNSNSEATAPADTTAVAVDSAAAVVDTTAAVSTDTTTEATATAETATGK